MSDWMTVVILVCIAISAARITIALNKIQRDEMTGKTELIASLREIAEQSTSDGIVDGVCQQTIRDALEALEKQGEQEKRSEPTLVVNIADLVDDVKVGICPACGKTLVNYLNAPTKYCKHCGKAVKWNEQHRRTSKETQRL